MQVGQSAGYGPTQKLPPQLVGETFEQGLYLLFIIAFDEEYGGAGSDDEFEVL
jgi:hypothetical protein